MDDQLSAGHKNTPKLDLEEEEEYNSEEDPDFDINKPVEDGSEDSDEEDDDDGAEDAQRPRKRQKRGGNEDGDIELESGDEATVQRTTKPRQKGGKRKDTGRKVKRPANEKDEDSSDYSEDDVGGEGGLIKTRAQKLREQHERKGPLTGQGKVTVDVDALWERLNAAPVHGAHPGRQEPEEANESTTQQKNDEAPKEVFTKPSAPDINPINLPDEEKITIKRVYKFAGEVITEEHVVPRNSAEAKLYLSSSDAAGIHLTEAGEAGQKLEVRTNEAGEPLIRPLRRFSRFDPNPPEAYKRSWGHGLLAVRDPNGRGIGPEEAASGANVNVSKLNTVEKSKLDWVTYVDRSGIKEDLDTHSRAKEGYLDRMDFLRRVDEKREEERKEARLKG
ncbi:swr complex subunit [Ascosphaera pollenicola]|nr:swr complex subunit [Ascosphaera pollenicola]